MKTFTVTEAFIQGAVSAEHVDDVIYPCRLPHMKKHLFPSPGDTLWQSALHTSGVRLRFETDASSICLRFAPLPQVITKHNPLGHAFDVVIDNEIVQTVFCDEDATEAAFDSIGKGVRTVELWLPPSCSVGLREIAANKDVSVLRPSPDRRPMWVIWGSSLTHCKRAGSAARIWPATVARRHNLNLVCLGFGGNCHLDPMVAMVIRDLPASYISMKLGINAVKQSLNRRTYPALVTAAVSIVREKHFHTPMTLISPIANPALESDPTPTGYTLEGMRTDMEKVHRALTAAGDMNLYYINGLDLFGVEDINRYAAADRTHPDAEGIDLQAERFSQQVIPLLLGS